MGPRGPNLCIWGLKLFKGYEKCFYFILKASFCSQDYLKEYKNSNVFLWKSCRKWSWDTNSRLLLFFKKTLFEIKETAKYFNQTNKTKFVNFLTVYPEIRSILIFRKGSGNNCSTAFCVWLFKKNTSYIILD